MATRPGPQHIGTTGAANGYALVYDIASDEYVPTPLPTLTVQDENANVATGVTQIDFQGQGVTATAGTGEAVVTIPGTAELLMADGVTSPPVPIETEAGDDWLYQD